MMDAIALGDPLKNVDAFLFRYLQDLNLEQLNDKNLSSVLPFLVKLLLNPHFTRRKVILKLIFHLKRANDVIQSLQTKIIEPQELVLNTSGHSDPGKFESGSPEERIRLVAIEYLRIQDAARQSNNNSNHSPKLQSSSLFDNALYLDDIIICFFALLNKSTAIPVINILDISEALLHVRYGPTCIVRLVCNMPERCQEVCQSLITLGEKQDECEKFNEISDQRAKTLRALCQLNPPIAYTVRSLTLQLGKMPSLTIMITLDQMINSMNKYNAFAENQMSHECESSTDAEKEQQVEAMSELETCFDSVVAFVTGILLGADEVTRGWFAQYVKSAQQKRIDLYHYTVLSEFRSLLLDYVQKLFACFLDNDCPTEESIKAHKINDSESPANFLNRKLIQVMATLRLYCALRGIGMLKLNQEESETLLRLVTCKQLVSRTSINLATTGVCTLLVCSSMMSNQKDEKRAAEWLRWLIKESHYNDDSYHGKCSISELLLLIAIHFQNNQTNQIAELIHAILGLKLQIKTSVSKCRSLFVQEVFTEQMIAEHAIRVPVTKNLDNTIKEFLPIHCIHQLLECRSFSKHQVPIKDWIFKQICESRKPIHHMLPELLGAYVNSLIVPTSVHGHCGTNQPISESDIMKVFKVKLYSIERKEPIVEDASAVNGDISPTNECNRKRKKIKKMKVEVERPPVETVPNEDAAESDELDIVDIEVAQILLLYYLMLCKDVRLVKNAEISPMDRIKLIRYSQDFMMDIPVFYLLQLVRDNQDYFGAILPPMLRLVASYYPHLCSIQHWLNTTEHYEPYKSKDSDNCASSKDRLCQRSENRGNNKIHSKAPLKIDETISKVSKQSTAKLLIDGFNSINIDPSKLIRTLTNILVMARDDVWTFVDPFIQNWTKVLHMKIGNDPDQKKLVRLTTKLWWKFNTIFPRKLWVMTINSLRMVQNGVKIGSLKSLEYSWDELTADPLIVLRCDESVFRTPEYLNILLHMLTAFLAASRRSLQDQMTDQPNRHKDVIREMSLEDLRTTLVLAQTSAAIQILLESCIPREDEHEIIDKRDSNVELDDNEKLIVDRFDESVSCICEHLHQVFIANTNLAKLVHFQTYPSELLATTSENIPSMHICFDFIPELLSQPDSSKQVFVIELTSHLCEKYAITKSLNVAKLCFNVAYTLLQLLPSDRRAQFYMPVLPALLRICKVFPILQEDARIILNQINQISIAHIASTSSRLSLNTSKPFEGLEDMTWIEIKKIMNSLSPNEALYLCIQKCMLDLDKMEEKDKQQSQQMIAHASQDKLTQPAYNAIFAYGNHVTNY